MPHRTIFGAIARLVVLTSLLIACNGGASAGSPCDTSSECQSALQCLQHICVARCQARADCGDGHRCDADGSCHEVVSVIGETCTSEWDCGPGQGCVLDTDDTDRDQILSATCQRQGTGASVGSECMSDSDCRNSLCALGHCGQVCAVDEDCPTGTSCERIPHILPVDSAVFRGCLQSSGVLSMQIPMTSPAERLHIAVPESAVSLSVVSQVDDNVHFVGASRVRSPKGELLLSGSGTLEGFLANPIRYLKERKVSTLMIPNSSAVTSLQTGIYEIDISAELPSFRPGTAIPEVTVFYKLGHSRTLDLHFYFLDLGDHPCRDEFGLGTKGETLTPLNATNASDSIVFQDYIAKLRSILAGGDIELSKVASYHDVDRSDLDGIADDDDLNTLFALADNDSGIAVFFVRSLSPDGVQARTGGTPGPPRMPHTSASGIAISMDTLCYRDWDSLARVTAHSIGGQMGLWNNRDPQGLPDPISDTDGSSDNLMFFGEFGGTKLSDQQKRILGGYSGLR